VEPADPHPTRRFSDRAQDYARYRPGYPPAAVEAILDGLGASAALTVADVGAGTGIFSRLLAQHGARVFAVEPNAAMRGAAAAHPRVTWVDGRGEATGLDAGSCDLVTVAHAFHWFDADAALRELQRVLRAGGRLAILWNRRSRSDPFTLGYRAALEANDAEAPAERSAFDPATVTSTGRFRNLRTRSFQNAQALSEEELIGRALSTSTVPREGPATERLLAMLRELHARHRGPDGRATMVYRTDLYLWDRG
jgi:SAM-dependent methyltransferase